ncbi:MAG: hypothetical protein ACRCTZ_09525 [Sarcina sp.]
MKIIIKKKDECKYIQGDELDCAFCKHKNTDKCKLRKYRSE